MNNDLREKIYSMSNSFLPLDTFYNDIELNSAENYDKEKAFKDLEIVADFILDLQKQLDEKEKMHLLDEKEFQHYCAYKKIETEIKGCLDREREYKKQLAEKDKEIEKLKLQQKHTQQVCKKYHSLYDKRSNSILKLAQKQYKLEQNQKQLAIQELEKAKVELKNRIYCCETKEHSYLQRFVSWENICNQINNQIKEIKTE